MASVLIVEDDRSVARLLEVILALEGHETEVLTAGRQALARLDGPPVELVLLDVMLPEIDGLVLLHEVRSRAAWTATKIVLLTALDDDDDIWRGWSGGADYYLTKPFDVDHLRTVSGRLLAGQYVDSTRVGSALGDLVVD